MNTYKYKALLAPALETYLEHGMTVEFEEEAFNATLVIEAPDEATAEKIRRTITDINMWEKLED
jgi:hypothetical protein|tara:strand:+ start:712 stop:903 length:192 start_codon:yes stop_codon:yes gene_type:complete